MKKKVFRDYAEVNEKLMEGYTVVRVETGINAEDTGLMMELEKTIDNVTIGIDVIYNPDHEEHETELMVSEEYVKHITDIRKLYKNGVSDSVMEKYEKFIRRNK